jgi:hypothetical protein
LFFSLIYSDEDVEASALRKQSVWVEMRKCAQWAVRNADLTSRQLKSSRDKKKNIPFQEWT